MTVEEHLAAVQGPRAADVRRLHELIVAEAPSLAVEATPSQLGYGPFATATRRGARATRTSSRS